MPPGNTDMASLTRSVSDWQWRCAPKQGGPKLNSLWTSYDSLCHVTRWLPCWALDSFDRLMGCFGREVTRTGKISEHLLLKWNFDWSRCVCRNFTFLYEVIRSNYFFQYDESMTLSVDELPLCISVVRNIGQLWCLKSSVHPSTTLEQCRLNITWWWKWRRWW